MACVPAVTLHLNEGLPTQLFATTAAINHELLTSMKQDDSTEC